MQRPFRRAGISRTIDIRPMFHWTVPQVCAHVLLSILAHDLKWHPPSAKRQRDR